MKYVLLISLLFMLGCGAPTLDGVTSGATGPQGAAGANGTNGQNGAQGVQGIAGPAASPSPSASPDPYARVKTMVSQYNQYRESIGQDDIMNGLGCTLYTVPNTTLKIVGATLTSVGSFEYMGTFNVSNQSTSDGLSILPVALQGQYQSWYIIKCIGYIAIGDSSWYEFDTNSDDGTNLYVDGTLVVNNDGLHSLTDVIGTKFLQANVHTFEIDFLQGTGNEALILNMNGTPLPSQMLYH